MWKMALVLCALIASSAHAQTSIRAATDAEIDAVLNASRGLLKDADSAKITNLIVMNNPNGVGLSFCGFLNAKNSYGGYTGGQLFGGSIVEDSKGNPLSAIVDGMDDGDTYNGTLSCKKFDLGHH